MAKPELGTKRLCAHCGAKFYDLSRDPIVCPKCGTVFQVLPTSPRGRTGPAVPAQVEQEEEALPAAAEFVSLEEADAEAKGPKGAGLPDVDDVEDEDIEDDSTFLEPEEDEGEDVSDIIGENIEDDEET